MRGRTGLADAAVVELQAEEVQSYGTAVPKMWSASSLAQRVDVSTAWVREWHRRGLLRGVVLHASPGEGRGVLLFREEDVVAFLASRGLPVRDNTGEVRR